MVKKAARFDFDVVVIGSGATGAVAAETVAATGRKVALIEASTFGGFVPNFGDLPRRAMLNAAHEFANLRVAEQFGLRTNTVGYGFPAMKNWKDTVIRRSGVARTAEYLRSKNVMVYRGRAHFLSRHELSIGQQRHISSDKFLIATGSELRIPSIPGLQNIDYLTVKNVFELNRPPRSLAIIGAGTSGIELAELFAILGTKVYLFEQSSRIASRFAPEVSGELTRFFAKFYGVSILPNTQVVAAANDGSAVRLKYLRGGAENSLSVERVLLATGAEPNTDIGLINAGVKFNDAGVIVNEFLQTSAANIYAAGDVITDADLDAATAIHQAQIAGYNLTHRRPKFAIINPAPRVIWTNPAVATVGATEDEFAARKIKYHKSIAKNAVATRANLTDVATGFTELLVGAQGDILGATIMSETAVDQIGQIALAMQNDLSVQHLVDVIQPFGSWNEVVKLAALNRD